jgi:hypothetical protein
MIVKKRGKKRKKTRKKKKKKKKKKKRTYGVKETGAPLASSALSLAARWAAVILQKNCMLVSDRKSSPMVSHAPGLFPFLALALRCWFLHWLWSRIIYFDVVVVVRLQPFRVCLIHIGVASFLSLFRRRALIAT